MSKPDNWNNRIVGQGDEDPEQLLANPRNWRIHPKHQQDALSEALDKIGWVQQVVVNKTTGHVVDGHLRVQLAITREEAAVPVVYVELSEEEEQIALATIDPLGDLAVKDEGALKGLLADLEGKLDSDILADLLDNREVLAPSPPTQDQIDVAGQRLDDRMKNWEEERVVDVDCPECGHGFGVRLSDLQEPPDQ